MSGEIPEGVLSAIRISTITHAVASAASLIAAIVLTANLPRMDGSGTAKVVVFWVMAFFSIMLPMRLMRRTTNAALKQTRAATCVVTTLCLICIGLMIHSLVLVVQRGVGVQVDSTHALSIALSLGLSMVALFVHSSATQMISEITIRRRIHNIRASLHAASTQVGKRVSIVGKRASMVIPKRQMVAKRFSLSSWQEKRDQKLRAARQEQERASPAATQEESIRVTVSK